MIWLLLAQIAGGSGLTGAPARPATPRATLAMPSVSSHAECLALAERDPPAAAIAAQRWGIAGGGGEARQCAALAASAQGHWADAAPRFEAAAREAAGSAIPDAPATLWAQAGNAWLAAGDAERARAALDSAIAANTLKGQALGEARLDRGRALVAAGDLNGARADLDLALRDAPADPLAWLLSATLARRQGELTRARADIAQALARSADDASVQLEAGNIAAAGGDAGGARHAWEEAARLAPGRPAGRSALAALAQFTAPGTPAPVTPATPAPKMVDRSR